MNTFIKNMFYTLNIFFVSQADERCLLYHDSDHLRSIVINRCAAF